MSLHIINTGLKINKATALKMAGQIFECKTRTTTVHIMSYDRIVHIVYIGTRNIDSINNGMKIVKVMKREVQ